MNPTYPILLPRTGDFVLSGPEGRRGRKRASIACNTCRERKTACDTARPNCAACEARGSKCIYLTKDNHESRLSALKRINASLTEDNKTLGENNKTLGESNKTLDESNRTLGESNRTLEKANATLQTTNGSLDLLVNHLTFMPDDVAQTMLSTLRATLDPNLALQVARPYILDGLETDPSMRPASSSAGEAELSFDLEDLNMIDGFPDGDFGE